MTPLVLLHGALSSGSQLEPLADALHRDDARTPDLPGHGANPAEPYDVASFVDAALAAAQAAGDGPVDLVGYSLGGYVALAAAIAHPERVRRVVTIATKLAWTPEVAAVETRRLDPDRLAEKAPAFVADLAERHPGPGWRTVLTETSTFLTGLGTRPPLELDRITAPTLVLVGGDDALVTRAECEDAVRRIPDARLDVLPDTPHQYERMDVAALASRIADFLA
jgi:pimeloyl-ACP methyl ester carboxylesterase